jgi:hypothetical protein
MTFDNLCSGLIGALVGSALSGFIAWWTLLNNAREVLRGKLLILKSYSLFEIGDKKSEHFKKFRETYPDILIAFIAYRNLLPLMCRYKIDDAFYFYRGGNKNELLKKNPLFLKHSHIDVASEFDFEQRIDKVLEAIEKFD